MLRFHPCGRRLVYGTQPVSADSPYPHLKRSLVELLPDLRAFARSLERDAERADDLVQETLTRALAALGSFRPGTNMGAWTFTILRNAFYDQRRRQRREVSADPALAETSEALRIDPPQEGRLAVRDLRSAFWRLTPELREALVLVTMRGLKHEEAAKICGCAVGTMKARVSRARARLKADLGGGAQPDPSP
ncbi:MAG: sigma-70 family RNA polymerase sigma factor [Alphaproteobacteria bacterium]|nr:sigma-70 family RNA polymerase sigma factor [Alphaproteobacteria bacterium]